MDLFPDRTEILIVDDDVNVVETIRTAFPQSRYLCVTATKAGVALEQLKQFRFSVVVCSADLPGIDGIEILRRCRSRSPHTAFIILTDATDSRQALEAMRLGAHACVPKPFSPSELVAYVEQVIESQRLKVIGEISRALLDQTLHERAEHLHLVLQQVGEIQNPSLELLMTALDTREQEVNLHSLRVRRFCLLLAERCGYSASGRQQLASGALLHDIGKIAIPDSILLKPAQLSPQEFRIVQHHSKFGYQVVSRIPHMDQAAALILSHHEKMDGTGYPLGLQGRAIPLEARIFAVADAVDVITAGRPYRGPRTMAQAREEIRRCSGTQFDPEVVDVFESIPDEEWAAAREDVAGRYSTLLPLWTKTAERPAPRRAGHPFIQKAH